MIFGSLEPNGRQMAGVIASVVSIFAIKIHFVLGAIKDDKIERGQDGDALEEKKEK